MIEVIWGALLNAWPTFLLFLSAVGAFVWLEQERPSWHSLAVILAFSAAIVLMSLYDFWAAAPYPDPETVEGLTAYYTQLGFLYEVWGTGLHAAGTVYAFVMLAFCFNPPKRGDFLLCGLASVVVFAEVWTAGMENLNCNFLQADIPAEMQTEAQRNMSKCERVFGFWYRYLPIIVEVSIMLFFVACYKWAKREHALTNP